MKWKPRSIAGAVAVSVLACAGLVIGLAPAAFANGARSGDAIPTNPNTQAPVPSGGSATAWTLNLPAQAACSGDTASHGYHVYSFIVPSTVDPGTLTFNPSTGPSQGSPLVDQTGSAYVAANTAVTTGQVIQIPTFNYNLFATTSMGGTKIATPPGNYRIGIACANTTGQADKYWDAPITFTANGGDPNGEVWALSPNTPGITGCSVSQTPAGQISSYPAWGGTQSALRVACVFQHDTGAQTVAKAFTIHDFKNVAWHNGAARTVTNTATIPAGASSFTITDCTGLTGPTWVNRGVDTADNSPGFKARTFVKSISGGCVASLDNTTASAIGAGTAINLENSSPRSVTDAVTATASTTLTSASANFTSADTGLDVTGTFIPLGTTITFVNTTTATLSHTADSGGTGETVSFGGNYQSTTARTVDDATSGTTTTFSSAAALFDTGPNLNDVGLQVTGTGLTGTCYITSNTATVATLTGPSCNASAVGGTNNQVTIGDPSTTAPLDGETVMDQGVQLDLNPTLVAGTRPCADNSVEGFHIEGVWENPGSPNWITGAFAKQPAGSKAIGQIAVRTSAGINYAAFIIESPSDAKIPAPHYNVAFPNVPTGLAECPATAFSPGLSYSLGITASTPSVALLPTGTGRPGTGQLRATKDNAQAGSNTTAFLTSEDPSVTYSGGAFLRICVIPAGAPSVGFKCGTG